MKQIVIEGKFPMEIMNYSMSRILAVIWMQHLKRPVLHCWILPTRILR